MKSIDEEWSRLTELYTQMSEGDLQSLAHEAYDLTDVARDVLRGEISRRGLRITLLDRPAAPEIAADIERAADFDPAELDLVGAGRAFDLQDARRIKTILEDTGIPSYFGPDNLENVEKLKTAFDAERTEALKRGFEVGIGFSVPRKYQQHASRALGQAVQETEADADPAIYADYVSACPRCHSPEIIFQGLETIESADPEVDSKYNWSCDACGHQWKDDGVEEEGKRAS